MKRFFVLLILVFFVLLKPEAGFPEEGQVPEDEGQAPEEHIAAYDSNPEAVKAVEKQIGIFTGTIKERFSLYLKRSGRYMELMKAILRENNIPEDMVFLPLIESGFNPYAYSRSRAVGPWQFIASTGKRYGLKIDTWVDERRDPVKSTWAASRYLNDLYELFGSWSLAMAAYNAGEGIILRALRKRNSDDYWDLLGTRYIRTETKHYVPKFIAARLIANNPEGFGFNDLEYEQHLQYDEVTLAGPIDLDVIAKASGATLAEIKDLNPELRRWCTPPNVKEYRIRIPKGKSVEFAETLAQIPEGERFTPNKEKILPEKGAYGGRIATRTYKVKKGDSLYSIARRAGVSLNALMAANSIEGTAKLRPGRELKIPKKETPPCKSPVKRASIKKKKEIRADKEKRTVDS